MAQFHGLFSSAISTRGALFTPAPVNPEGEHAEDERESEGDIFKRR